MLSSEFGVAGERVKSYRDSYHGLASQFGSKVVANCASCHGVHNIFPSTDARSMIHPVNLARTCGQCHVGAGENFAKGKIHLTSALVSDDATERDMAVRGTRIVRWISSAWRLPSVVKVGCWVRPSTSQGNREARFCTSRSHASPPGPVTGAGGKPSVDSQHHSSRMSVLG